MTGWKAVVGLVIAVTALVRYLWVKNHKSVSAQQVE
jgi:hypothetical protein